MALDGSTTGNPTIPATGEKQLYETDFTESSLHAFSIRRTYRSQHSEAAASFGGYWLPSISAWLNVVAPAGAASTAKLTLGSGNIRGFTRAAGATAWVSDSIATDTLSTTANGYEYRRTEDDSIWRFDTTGKLLTHTQRNGWVMTYAYNAANQLTQITNHFGRSLALAYSSAGQVSQIMVPGGNVISYGYDTANRLTTVLYPDNRSKTYHYENSAFPQALTGVTDERGVRLATYSYDAQGRAIETVHAGGANRYAVTYPATTGAATQVTDPLGTTRSYNYATQQSQLAVTGANLPSGQGLRDAATRVQNPAGLIDSETDFLGIQTIFNWDTVRRLPLSVTKAVGRPEAQTVQTEWHPTFRLPTRVTEAGRVTTTTYDALGNQLTQTVTDTSATPSVARTWAWQYNAQGLVSKATAPNGGTTTYAYNAQGNPSSMTNPLGHVTAYTYGTTGGAEGRIAKALAPNGMETAFTYDLRGRVTSTALRHASMTTAALTTTYAYTPSGQLGTLTLPSGHQITYGYDAAQRLSTWADNRGARGTYTLDAMGNRTREEVRDTLGNLVWQHSRAINAINRVASEAQGANQVASSYSYNANGSLSSEVTGGKATVYGLDAIRRVQSMTNAANATASLQYNARDDVTRATDFKGVATNYNRDALGNATAEATPDAGARSTEFDALGLPSRIVNALGQATQITRDAAGRPINITRADGKTTTLVYDLAGATYNTGGLHGSKGYLSEIRDPEVTTRYQRDPLGRIARISTLLPNYNGTSLSTFYTYILSGPGAGEVDELTYGNGSKLKHLYNAAGQVVQLNWNNTPLVSGIAYNALGMPTSYTWPFATSTTSLTPLSTLRVYDTAGRLSQTDFASYAYDAAGNVSAINQVLWKPSTTTPATPGGIGITTVTWALQYDALNRLTRFEATNAAAQPGIGNVIGADLVTFSYDANGNRSAETRRATSVLGTASSTIGTARSPRLEPASNRLLGFNQTLTQGTASATSPVPYSLNAAGDLVHSGLSRHHYNAWGRPVSHVAGSTDQSNITRYAHNTLGQRVFKTEPFLPNLSGDEADPAYPAQLQAHWNQSWNPGTATNPQAAQESLGWAYLYGHADHLGESTLLGEFGNGTVATGNTQHIYLPTPQGPLPVAVIISGTRFAVQADHLHTPRRLSFAPGVVMWQWPYSAFGEEPPTQRRYRFANPATVNLGLTSNGDVNYSLRYPGQHFDGESGLHYNHFRTYDPRQGRYTQSDPIGLLGGWNRFGYVEGNAFSFTDPLGLETCVMVTRGLGGLGTHAALFISRVLRNEGDKSTTPALYDPAGNYARSTNFAYGDRASMSKFAEFHKKKDNDSTDISCKNTSAEEEQRLYERALAEGPQGGLACSISVSNVLSGSPYFPNVSPGTFFPGNLMRSVR